MNQDTLSQVCNQLAILNAFEQQEARLAKGGLVLRDSDSQLLADVTESKRDLVAFFTSTAALFEKVNLLLQEPFKALTAEQQQEVTGDGKKLAAFFENMQTYEIKEDKLPTLSDVCGLSEGTLQWIYQVAYQKIQEKKEEEALVLLSYLTYLNPGIPEALTSMAFCCVQLEAFDQAIETLNYTLQLAPEQWLAHLLLIECYFKLGRSTSLQKQWETFDKVFANHPEKEAFAAKRQALLAKTNME